MNKSDPVAEEYYSPLKAAERVYAALFFATAACSIFVLQIDGIAYPSLHLAVQSSFVLGVFFVFACGLAVRLYWSSRAHLGRTSDFLSRAFDVALMTRTSDGYYNNNEVDPFRRTAAALLENTLFSKKILRHMLRRERIAVSLYAGIWLLALLNRATDIALITAAAQVLFSEHLVSRWIRMEWLRARVEGVYEDTYSLVQSAANTRTKEYQARVVEYLLRYETGKAQAGISISSRIFEKLNAALSQEWLETARTLGIQR